MGALDAAVLADVSALERMRGDELRALGRAPAPDAAPRAASRASSGSDGTRRSTWPARRIRRAGARAHAASYHVRGMPNESYYAAQKARAGRSARTRSTTPPASATRLDAFGLKEALGVAASTCSYSDWIGTDLIVFIGSNVANNQPVTTKYLHQAKKAGTRVAVLNPLREPGMERYWIPSKAESALFGTQDRG